MRRLPDVYRVSVRVMLYHGPNYVTSLAFRVRPVPQDGPVDAWMETFAEKMQAVAESLAVDAAG